MGDGRGEYLEMHMELKVSDNIINVLVGVNRLGISFAFCTPEPKHTPSSST